MSVLSSEEPQLASLLESIFGETGFQVSVTREESYQVVDFEVLDPDGISCRNRISIFYVTPLYESDAGISYAPKFVGFVTFENYLEPLQRLSVMKQTKRARRRSRNV
eukprot:jgi/Galph1/4133/GphlegSOOS_G44.1